MVLFRGCLILGGRDYQKHMFCPSKFKALEKSLPSGVDHPHHQEIGRPRPMAHPTNRFNVAQFTPVKKWINPIYPMHSWVEKKAPKWDEPPSIVSLPCSVAACRGCRASPMLTGRP